MCLAGRFLITSFSVLPRLQTFNQDGLECIGKILHGEVGVLEVILHQGAILIHPIESKPREAIPATIQTISTMICQTL